MVAFSQIRVGNLFSHNGGDFLKITPVSALSAQSHASQQFNGAESCEDNGKFVPIVVGKGSSGRFRAIGVGHSFRIGGPSGQLFLKVSESEAIPAIAGPMTVQKIDPSARAFDCGKFVPRVWRPDYSELDAREKRRREREAERRQFSGVVWGYYVENGEKIRIEERFSESDKYHEKIEQLRPYGLEHIAFCTAYLPK